MPLCLVVVEICADILFPVLGRSDAGGASAAVTPLGLGAVSLLAAWAAGARGVCVQRRTSLLHAAGRSGRLISICRSVGTIT